MNIRKLTPKLILVAIVFVLLYYFGALDGLAHHERWRPVTNVYTIDYSKIDYLHMADDYHFVVDKICPGEANFETLYVNCFNKNCFLKFPKEKLFCRIKKVIKLRKKKRKRHRWKKRDCTDDYCKNRNC